MSSSAESLSSHPQQAALGPWWGREPGVGEGRGVEGRPGQLLRAGGRAEWRPHVTVVLGGAAALPCATKWYSHTQ